MGKLQTDKSHQKKQAPAQSARTSRRKRHQSFRIYILKVLRQVHRDLGISKKAMNIMNSFIYDTFERIGSECAKLVRIEKRKTLYARDVQTAIKLILTGELAQHAISEAVKCLPHGPCCSHVSKEVKNCREMWMWKPLKPLNPPNP